MPDPQQRRAFVGSSYGIAAQRAYLGAQVSDFCPHWVTGWGTRPGYAILTAWNPHGVQADASANAQAQARLRADLARYPVQAGHNGAGQWREDTLIVAGLGLKEARALGQKYAQAAVVWGVGRRAALVWCEGLPESDTVERFWWSQQAH